MLSFLILLVSYLTLLPKNSGTWNIATGIFCSNSLSPPNPTSAPMDILGLILCHRYPNFAVCTHEHVVGSTTSRRRRCGVLQTPPNVWMKKVGRRRGRVWSTECKAETQWLAFLVALKTNLSRLGVQLGQLIRSPVYSSLSPLFASTEPSPTTTTLSMPSSVSSSSSAPGATPTLPRLTVVWATLPSPPVLTHYLVMQCHFDRRFSISYGIHR